MSPSPFLAAALEYARAGSPVIPLHNGLKTPRVRRWPEVATIDEAQIRSWWAAWPRANVAIVTGDRHDHKLVVLDVDVKNGGAIPEWAPPTLTAQTPTGGWHLYFKVPLLSPVRNAVNIGGPEHPGLDVRADRGYVVAPPSVIITRRDVPPPSNQFEQWFQPYTWLDERPPASLDDPTPLLPAHLRGPSPEGARPRFEYRDDVPVGQRNNYLTSLAGHLFALGESREAVRDALEVEASDLDFSPRDGEIAQIVRSVARYHR